MEDTLFITINERGKGNDKYTLSADGKHSASEYNKETGHTIYSYPLGAVVFLYYNFSNHLAVYVIRNSIQSPYHDWHQLPSTSKPARILIRIVDTPESPIFKKTKVAVKFLNKYFNGAYHFSDYFYSRLSEILKEKGKLPFDKIKKMAVAESALWKPVRQHKSLSSNKESAA